MYLTSDSDLDTVADALTPGRSSQARRRELERIAGLCSPRDVSVHVRLVESGAACRPADGHEDGDDRDAYVIRIPTRRYEQPYTDLAGPVWDRLIQVAFLFHELGHVLYSGFDRFADHLEAVEPRWRSLFKHVYNAAEDAAIERQVADAFRVHADFVLKSATLSTVADRRHREFVELFDRTELPASVASVSDAEAIVPEDRARAVGADAGDDGVGGRAAAPTTGAGTGAGGRSDGASGGAGTASGEGPVLRYTVYEAVRLSLLDRGTVDSGRRAALLDPSDPGRRVKGDRTDVVRALDDLAADYVEDMLSEPDPGARVDRAREFFETVRPTFEELPPLQRRRVQTTRVRPADVLAAAGWSPRRARRLAAGGGGGGGNATPESVEVGAATVDPTAPGSVLSGIDTSRLRRRHVGRGTGGPESAFRGELRRLVDLVADDETSIDRLRVVEPDEGGDSDRWPELRESARRLESQLRTRLRKERRPRERPRSRRGGLDGRRLVDAVRGSERVFSRLVPGKEKDYACQLVLDRSGSMGSLLDSGAGQIRPAEDAVARLAAALHGVGVDVSVLSLYEGLVTLELPFGVDPASCADRLLTGRADGGTPLSDAVTVARRRVGHGEGRVPFVVVVTDGGVDDEDGDAYRREVDRCHCPVYGVYLDDGADHDTYFDRVVYTGADGVGPALRDLVRNLFREAT